MRKYIITHNGRGRIVEVPPNTSADKYGRIQEAFATEARDGAPPADVYDKHATMFDLAPWCVSEGIPYHEELAGPDGMSYLLFTTPDTDREQVTRAKDKIRRDHDVMHLREMRLQMI